jgi:hypothetical protein
MMARMMAGSLLAAAASAWAGADPPEYTKLWGSRVQGCNACHGRPPALPHSESASRIVAVGAGLPDGAAMRKAMSHERVSTAMQQVLEDPELTDARLEAIRRYLVVVRDGALPAEVAFDKPGATREVVFRNERSPLDKPVKLARVRASGPFRVVPGGTCKEGGRIAGQAACSVKLRFAGPAGDRSDGALELKFADTPELQPQPSRTRLVAASGSAPAPSAPTR